VSDRCELAGGSCPEAQTQTQTQLHDPVGTNFTLPSTHTQPVLRRWPIILPGRLQVGAGRQGRSLNNTVAFRNSVCYRRPDLDATETARTSVGICLIPNQPSTSALEGITTTCFSQQPLPFNYRAPSRSAVFVGPSVISLERANAATSRAGRHPFQSSEASLLSTGSRRMCSPWGS
jgi:hypothetical protein